MKLFLLLKQHFSILGIHLDQDHQKSSINRRIFLILLIHAHFIGSSIGFLLFESNSILEFADCFYIINTALASAIILLSNISKMHSIFELINTLETIIENSKFELIKLLSKV